MDDDNLDEDSNRVSDLIQDNSSDSGSEDENEADVHDQDGDAESGRDTNDESDSGSDSGEDELGFSSDASNGDSEKCPICLQRFNGQEIGVPDNCEHHFCLLCIAQWAKKVTTCPIDRKSFNSIMVKNELNGEIKHIEDVTARDATSVDWDEQELDPTFCEICGHSDREDRLLLCDGCDLGFHLECLEPALDVVPIDDWYCPQCLNRRNALVEPGPSTSIRATNSSRQSSLRVPRTSLSRRIMQQRQMVSSSCQTKPKLTKETKSGRPRKKAGTKSRRKYKTKAGKRVPTRSKRRRKKRRVKRTTNATTRNPNRCRVAQQMKPTTAKGRLAQNLGLILPRTGQPLIGLPSYRPTNVSPKGAGSRAPQRRKRYQDGIAPSLSLFGSPYDLSECLATVSDDEGSVGVARVQPFPHIGMPRKLSIGAGLRSIEPLNLSSSSNVLGPILNSQSMLHVRAARNLTSTLSISSDKFFSIPPLSMNRELDNDSSGYDSALGNGEFPANTPQPNSTFGVPFLSAAGGNSSSSIRPNSSNNSDSNSTTNSGTSNASDRNSSGGGNGAPNSMQYRPGLQSNTNDGDGLGYARYVFPPAQGVGNPILKETEPEQPDSKAAEDEDDDYNIYSDIEEEPKEDASANEGTINTQESVAKVEDVEPGKKDHDSDSDMVIDEELPAGVPGSQEREARNSVESQLAPTPTLNLGPMPEEKEAESVGEPTNTGVSKADQGSFPAPHLDSDSDESIPLPDSTPPPSNIALPEELEEEDVVYLPQDNSIKKDEYDPSQPLTSSEDDEETLPISLPAKVSTDSGSGGTKPVPAGSSGTKKIAKIPSSDDDNEDEIDLNSIPMPSDEYRRPTIQFSIPSRHRLIPISSLIKRQKGVMRKETKVGATQSFQSEISKAFGTEKGEDEEDEESVGGKPANESVGDQPIVEKVSLVAEIFGSDDDEDEIVLSKVVAAESDKVMAVPSTSDPVSSNLSEEVQAGLPEITTGGPGLNEIDASGSGESRWKKIVQDEVPIIVPIIAQIIAPIIAPIIPAAVTEVPTLPVTVPPPVLCVDDVEVIEVNSGHVNNKKARAEGSRGRLAGAGKVSGSFLESISDEENEFDNSSLKMTAGKRKDKVVKDHRTLPRKEVLAVAAKNSKKEIESEKDTGRRVQKRRRSVSPNTPSNYEEGEISESPDKKKRKPRKTKRKHRRKSRDGGESDSMSSKGVFSDKQGQGPHSSSSEEEGRRGIPWKKPSKSTKERNYRDGKPKTEEKFFREKEKRGDPNTPAERRKQSPGTSTKKARSKDRDQEKAIALDSKRGYRRSVSKSPLPWRSTSRSVSKSKTTRPRRKSNSSSPNKSLGSRSPSVHGHSRLASSRSPRSRRWKRRRRHSVSQRRGFRSRSRSRTPPRVRSRSPAKRTHTRRRSRSLSSRERKRLRRRSGSSSSGSRDRSVSPRTKAHKKTNFEDKLPKKCKKDKEKPAKDKPNPQELPQQKDKEKDKDKKRKRRKREKSASPAKEIFTDGDSIVVSLNFQKSKEVSGATSSANNGKDASATGKNEHDLTDQRKRKGKHSRKSSTDRDGKSKPLKKTILIDLESSPIQEQNIGVSPTLIVLSDDEDGLLESSRPMSGKSGRGRDGGSDRDGVAVSTTSVGNLHDVSPAYRHSGHGVPADSTQLQPQQSDSHAHLANSLNFSHGSVSGDEGSLSSPTRGGDSLVTSTRDSVEIPLPHDEDTLSPSSPQPPQARTKSPNTPPLPPGTPPLDKVISTEGSSHQDPRSLSPSPPMGMGQTLPLSLPPPPGINLGMGSRPMGIGNIPGLFPSSSMTMGSNNLSGISSAPAPIVIPTPPPAQIRFNPSVLNANVIASVANALYAPLLAAKQLQQQQQQALGRFPIQMNSGISNLRVGDRQGQGTVLLPKNQNSHSSNNRRGGEGGDSPFSPNSSEGDDLFEPPTEKSKSPKDDRQTMNSYGGSNQDKSDRSSGGPGNSSSGGGHSSGNGGKGKNVKLFDTLFGGSAVVKKSNQVQPGSHQHKSTHPDKSFKPKLAHKQKTNRKAQKKEIVKISEGELRLSEDVPTSAVELRVKEKFLKKLNRQERVVEEVKLSLKPHYSKKHVNKDEYKEILRRAVPKICHNKSGEINPFKIKELIEAYVKKFRKNRKP